MIGEVRVFVSHGSGDAWVAHQMARCIGDQGATVFPDVNDLETGDDFKRRIRAEIARSDELVALLTPISRRRSWLWVEIGAAWVLGKRIAAIMYGVSRAELDADGGMAVLEDRHFRELNMFDTYLDELRRRVTNG
jgi:hypothetical protein